MTCGSVDDGKSTLIGRLLFDSKRIFEDHLRALERDSQRYGTQGPALDLALLVDGLQAEREQGITIDVAYRFFATDRRSFIVADTPGHEQYTRNMATGASTAELAVVLIDARKGVLTQTKRHTRILAMMGITHVVLAVNKMDLVEFAEARFKAITDEYRSVAGEIGVSSVQAIPMSALHGDNVVHAGARMPWYRGPSLLSYLESVDVSGSGGEQRFRMPVQWICRPSQEFRGAAGRVAAGCATTGRAVTVWPSGVSTTIRGITLGPEPRHRAERGESTMLTFADEVDVIRGDVIADAAAPLQIADQFEAQLLWMSEHPMIPSRPYLLKTHAKEVTASVTALKHRIDADTGAPLAAKTLALNEIALVNLSLSQPIPFEPYSTNRTLGGFILIDQLTFETVAAGMIVFALRRAANLHWQSLEVDHETRARIKHQTARCIWLTGLSGAGKSTIASRLEQRLMAAGRHTYVIDGDNVRHGLNRDLGFTEADRAENVRRVAEVARLMVDAGLIVIVSLISPYRAERRLARSLFDPGAFIEVFVDTPLDECERRDPKGLYAKARSGALPNFTGIDSPYEPPQSPEIHLRTSGQTVDQCIATILESVE
ncbi:MAG TPA: adenylyl-sulfate kinase [Vicinamibacterales bacterium]|nr:adenylyl-sulfate kinase [Vicinamibacterales bacterium]